MASLHPVLWTKGTLLTPQHLQAQDRYFDTLLRGQLGALVFAPWGLTRLELDRAALAGGSVAVRAAGGRFADGLLFDAPAADPLPAPRALADAWSQDQRALLVSLAVPEYRPGARNVAAGAPAGGGLSVTRWSASEQAARDETTGLAERPIQLARPNLRLVLEGESIEGMATIPVARILRDASGALSLDAAFVPPLLDFAASEVLVTTARRIVERVAAKAAALSGTRRQRNQGLADFSITDVAAFWLLYTLNTHLPSLRHLAEVRLGHPSDLWEAMVALAGALGTFATSPQPLPVYDHARPGECFAALERRLLELLETAVPESAVALPLRPVSASVHAVAVDEERLLRAPHWYLAVSATLRQADVVARVLHGCKVGSADVVDTLIRQALPGLTMAHVAHPPTQVPVKLDYLYFALDRRGPAWDAVARARNLAVYVPAELGEVRLELVCVLE